MDKKKVIIIIGLFLAVLFVATIGTSLTGFVISDNSEVSLEMYPFPFVKNSVYNDVYIVMPQSPKTTDFSAALRVANSLKSIQALQTSYAKIVTEATLPEGDHNLILIGDGCSNKLILRELEITKRSKSTECFSSIGLNEGEGLIQVVNHRRTTSLILAGDVNKASRVLIGNVYPLSGQKITIKGKRSFTLEYG